MFGLAYILVVQHCGLECQMFVVVDKTPQKGHTIPWSLWKHLLSYLPLNKTPLFK